MIRPRRASVITALTLLGWTSTASAECAWVLWRQSVVLQNTMRPARSLFPLVSSPSPTLGFAATLAVANRP